MPDLDPTASQPGAEPQARGHQEGQGHARRRAPDVRGVQLRLLAKTYGERGEGFIAARHTRPVHEIRPDHVTRLADLALVYAPTAIG
jgi:hypothetical protein